MSESHERRKAGLPPVADGYERLTRAAMAILGWKERGGKRFKYTTADLVSWEGFARVVEQARKETGQ